MVEGGERGRPIRTRHHRCLVTPKDPHRRLDEEKRALVALLLRTWDPLGVQTGVHAPANEYDSYVQGVLSIIHSGGDVGALAAFLGDVRTVKVGRVHVGGFPRNACQVPAQVARLGMGQRAGHLAMLDQVQMEG